MNLDLISAEGICNFTPINQERIAKIQRACEAYGIPVPDVDEPSCFNPMMCEAAWGQFAYFCSTRWFFDATTWTWRKTLNNFWSCCKWTLNDPDTYWVFFAERCQCDSPFFHQLITSEVRYQLCVAVVDTYTHMHTRAHTLTQTSV